MSDYNFDRMIDRRKTSSLKWGLYKDTDVIPMWVADMDFKAPEPVIRALSDRIGHGVFGYTLPPDELFEVIVSHLKSSFDWIVDKSWIVPVPGVVTGLNQTSRAVGEHGDRVLVPVPVYPPFFDVAGITERVMDKIPMITEKGRLTFDCDAFEKAITPKTRLFLFCTPHNPGGTVFSRDELKKLAGLAQKHNLVICSDEIHADLIFDGPHRPTAVACPEIADRIITLMAPSKSYNIPGLGFSFAVISNPKLRDAFKKAGHGIVPHVNTLGFTAAIAAYKDGGAWLKAVLAYLKVNRDLVHERINSLPGLSALCPQGTYLTWIDARKAGLSDPVEFFEKAGVGLSDGRYFGQSGFLRLNFGCSRSLLTKALDRMEVAINSQTGG